MVFVKLTKTYCNLANFESYFIAHSLGIIDRPTLNSLRMGQFANSAAAHPRTKEVEVTSLQEL